MKTGFIEHIKERITCPDYMQREHGSKITGGRCKSFRPDAKNLSSLMVNERDWYDFGSGTGGDIIDLAAIDKFSGDKGQAIKYLAENWGIKEVAQAKPQIEIVFRSYLKILDLASQYYHTKIHDRLREYLRGRGLTDETIKALRIGWAENPCEYLKKEGFTMEQIADSGILSFVNRIMVPYLRNDQAVYMIGRSSVWDDLPSNNADAKYMKLFRNDLSEHPIWGIESLRNTGTVIIAEGIFDAISCWQEKYPVVTAVTGAFSAEQKKDLLPALKGRDVIVCMDYDPETHAGQKFTENLANELFEAGISTSVVFLQGKGSKQDISALYTCDPERKTLEKIFSRATPWERVQIERISDIISQNERRAALTKFLRRCATVFDWPVVAQLVEDVKNDFDKDKEWLEELKKELKKSPPELEMVNLFKQKHDCVFHENLGWYEYAETVWKRISEFEVRQKIAILYGKHCTARNVDAVYKLLKAKLIRVDLFNESPDLLNFPNGMFNVETSTMIPHSRDYYSNIQMAYPYDENALCPKWMKFIEEITAGDEQRVKLLQEMFGYCLTKDVRYQKCFCLIGNGANGKSVLLNILEAMVGEANTSHVEVAYLQSDFQRIGLLSSLVNICNDMHSDVSGTDAFFKAIVAGDPITACFKGKDFVNFKPFCKMVFSANRMLTSRDADYAILRRFCFITFPVTFVDEETDKPGEKKKNPNIYNELLEELPGIFNWSICGLYNLRENNKFTETADQASMSKDMMSINNPLISFIEDIIGNGNPVWQVLVSRKSVYTAYNEWCKETNSQAMSSRTFWPRLRQIFPYTESRNASERFVKFTKPLKYCGE